MAKIKVIHLEMNGQHYYFGSLKALHETMGAERMGMKFNSFHSNVRVSPDKSYTNRRLGYTIRMGYLTQTKTNRNASHLHPLSPEQEYTYEEPTLFTKEPSVVEAPVVETPVMEEPPIVEEAPIVEETPKEAPKGKRSKKQKDDYGQLDLFGM